MTITGRRFGEFGEMIEAPPVQGNAAVGGDTA